MNKGKMPYDPLMVSYIYIYAYRNLNVIKNYEFGQARSTFSRQLDLCDVIFSI